MDIKNIIAQASAKHMARISTALEDLGEAITEARAAGFEVRLKSRQEDDSEEARRHTASAELGLSALSTMNIYATLHYTVSIRERDEG